MRDKYMIFKNSEKGVSLIITFFILTIVLAVVLGISIILYREIKIIRNIGNSVVAFYLADSGIEKTLYYDRKNKPVGVTSGVCAMCDAFNPTCPLALTEQILNCNCAILAGTDCDPLSCTSCDVSFSTDIGGNKNYNVAVNVSVEDGISDLRIGSTGDFKNTKRAIKVSSKKEEEFGAPRWLDGWSRRKKITIENDYIDYDLIDFPLYVKIVDDADMSSAMAGGNDIRFTLYDGTTLLKYEKEKWSGGGGSVVNADFWVKIPVLTSINSTSIYIYYGKADAVDGQDAANVWDSNYKAVYHLKEIGTGSAGDYKDSTSNANNSANTTYQPTVTTSGIIGSAEVFDGSDRIISVNNIGITGSGARTQEAWIKPAAYTARQAIIDFGVASEYQSSLFAIIDGNIRLDSWNSNYSLCCISDNVWQHFVATFSSGTITLFKDGSLLGSSGGKTFNTAASSAWIGHSFNENPWTSFNGPIDEVRISNTARSATWIKFEYHNMAQPDNELEWGAEE